MEGREIGWAMVEGIIAGLKPSVKEEAIDFDKIFVRYNVLEEEKKLGLKPEELVKDIMPKDEPWKTIAYAVFKGDAKTALEETKKALEKFSPKEIVDKGLAPGMHAVSKLYDDGIYYLPQVMLSADAMSAAVQFIEQKVGAGKVEKKGKVVMHVAEGDIHDLGKNLAKVFLVADGWEVIDLGRDVPVDEVVKAVEKHKPVMVTGTALMTTTMTAFPKIAKKLIEKGIKIPFICGGGAVNEDFVNTFELGVIAKKAHQAPKFAEAAKKGISWEELRAKWHEIAPA
ncbi:MAG: cobalamin-dependent protein [Archaeoglobaceae archaeon]